MAEDRPPAHAGPYALATLAGADGEQFAALVAGDRVKRVADDMLDLLRDWPVAEKELAAAAAARTGGWRDLDGLTFRPPVSPGQVLQSGANYRRHVVDLVVAENDGMSREQAEEMMDRRAREGRPYLFIGLASAMCGAYDDVVLPRTGVEHDWELELALVIGAPARHVPPAAALDHVAGYTICNDLTTRDLVYRPDLKKIGTDWLAAKNAPTFLPTGPYLVPARHAGDPMDLRITLRHNGRTRQDESTADMIFDVPTLVSYASSLVQLMPGDLILTGSPAGNGAHWGVHLTAGDVLEGEITGLGRQRNECVPPTGRATC